MDWVLLSATARVGRVELAQSYADERQQRASQPRRDHDVIVSVAAAPLGYVAAVTSRGRGLRLELAELPVIDPVGSFSLVEGVDPASLLPLADGEVVVALYDVDPDGLPLALGTREGTVKRVVPEYKGWQEWELMAVKDGDEVIGAAPAADADELVFITTDAQLLRFSARAVRPQGRPAAGMVGIKLAPEARALAFAVIGRAEREVALVTTVAGGSGAAPRTVKVTAFELFPAKGRATGGVRCHRFLKDQEELTLGWAGLPPARACDADGSFRNLGAAEDRRDGAGTRLSVPLYAVG